MNKPKTDQERIDFSMNVFKELCLEFLEIPSAELWEKVARKSIYHNDVTYEQKRFHDIYNKHLSTCIQSLSKLH